jgi:hypothetical protein
MGRPMRGRLTRLGIYMREHKLRTDRIADIAGISRQHRYRLQVKGKCEPTQPVIVC